MNINTLLEILLSDTSIIIISIITVLFIGAVSYKYGFIKRFHSEDEKTSKKEFFLSLKSELSKLTDELDIRKKISFVRVCESVNNSNCVDMTVRRKSNELNDIISKYNELNFYTIAGDILCNQFEKKYTEIFGSMYHKAVQTDSYGKFEFEEFDAEIKQMKRIAYISQSIDRIFDSPDNESQQEVITELFRQALETENADKFQKDENGENPYCRYMAEDFDFKARLLSDSDILQKRNLLISIKEKATELSTESERILNNIK